MLPTWVESWYQWSPGALDHMEVLVTDNSFDPLSLIVLIQLISGFQQHQMMWLVAHVVVVVVVGQFYVMMNPEVLQTASPRTIAPRTHTYTA